MTIVAGGWIRGCLFPINFIFLPLIGKIIVITGLSLVFLLRFYILGVKSVKFETLTSWGSYYTGSMWFLPFLTSIFFIPLLYIGSKVIKSVDQGWVEFMGGQGLIKKSSFFVYTTRYD